MSVGPARLRRLLLRLAPGAEADGLPDRLAVRRGIAAPVAEVGERAVDAALGRVGDVVAVGRVFRSRAAEQAGAPLGARDEFAADEVRLGFSRTLEVVVHTDRPGARLLDALRGVPGVAGAAANHALTSFTAPPAPELALPEPARRHALVAARFAAAHAIEPGDPDVVIAILDTGVAADHPELWGRLLPGYDFVSTVGDSVGPLTVTGDRDAPDADPDDEQGHGSAVASILCARGLRMSPGAAGRVRAVSLRVLATGRHPGGASVGVGSLADIDRALKHAVDRGADVVNLSLGAPRSEGGFGLVPHAAAVAYARARQVVLVAASGNSGAEEAMFPAASDGVLAVGAADPLGRECGFSTRGPHVQLLAPGVAIYGASHHGGYRFVSGTSFAAPYAAAAAALVVSCLRRHRRPVEEALVRQILLDGARPGGGARPTLDAGRALEITHALVTKPRERAA